MIEREKVEELLELAEAAGREEEVIWEEFERRFGGATEDEQFEGLMEIRGREWLAIRAWAAATEGMSAREVEILLFGRLVKGEGDATVH